MAHIFQEHLLYPKPSAHSWPGVAPALTATEKAWWDLWVPEPCPPAILLEGVLGLSHGVDKGPSCHGTTYKSWALALP